jgi:hypothetical protein
MIKATPAPSLHHVTKCAIVKHVSFVPFESKISPISTVVPTLLKLVFDLNMSKAAQTDLKENGFEIGSSAPCRSTTRPEKTST